MRSLITPRLCLAFAWLCSCATGEVTGHSQEPAAPKGPTGISAPVDFPSSNPHDDDEHLLPEDDTGEMPNDDLDDTDDAGQIDDADDTDANGEVPNDDDTGEITPPDTSPARYPAEALISPVSPSVVNAMNAIRSRNSTRADNVFMKVGASGTVNTRLLFCFSAADTHNYTVDLAGRADLQATIDYYNSGNAANSKPFDRPTLAAQSGRSASWAISGNPSPMQQEIDAINPRFAVVNYGTNDMNLGTTYQSALWPFLENMSKLLDQLDAAGIIPIVTGLNPRTDNAAAGRWVPTYNQATRALAEKRQLPYLDLYHASVNLPNQGLLADGIHGNSYATGGGSQPCMFTAMGLAYNYNIRNLLSIQALHDVRTTVLANDSAPDEPGAGWLGTGSPNDPFIVDTLPFIHHANTQQSPHRLIDSYPACGASQNEAGPEYYYELTLAQSTPLRFLVVDRGSTDVDLHLLADGDASSCVARAHRIIERPVAAGTWTIVVDTFVNASQVELAGEYSLIILPCAAGDEACN